jgi:hypothetical protein
MNWNYQKFDPDLFGFLKKLNSNIARILFIEPSCFILLFT